MTIARLFLIIIISVSVSFITVSIAKIYEKQQTQQNKGSK